MKSSLALLACLALAACGGGGGAADPTTPPPPTAATSALQYPYAQAWLEVGAAFGPWQPSVTGGTASQYAVSPALPAGLSLDPSTGVLSGTARSAAPQSVYTISANVAGTSVKFDLTLAVQMPPSGLSYSSPVRASIGTPLSALSPVVSGNVDSYAIAPALPDGLQFDAITGVLSGTPSRARPSATYTITAYNNGGSSTTFDLSLGVGPPAPGVTATGAFRDLTVIGLGYVSGTHSGLTDGHGQFNYEGGQSISFKVGNVSLGTVSVPKALLTPVDLVANGTGASNYVLNVVRFLMMLDQDGDASNGVQISTAVSTAAASWSPIDFNTADLPTALSAVIQQASTADGVTHTLPDATAAQKRLRAEFYCTYSGRYDGISTENSAPGDHGPFTAEVYPDGSVRSIAYPTPGLVGFNVMTADALNPLLDASFALNSQSPSIALQGSFSDPTFLSGTYLADAAGTFEAVGDMSTAPTYKFVGTYTSTSKDPAQPVNSGLEVLGMDEFKQVSGSHVSGSNGSLQGLVTGTTFEGTVTVRERGYGGKGPLVRYQVSGTFANTDSGYTLDGQYGTAQGLIKFSTVGCRAN